MNRRNIAIIVSSGGRASVHLKHFWSRIRKVQNKITKHSITPYNIVVFLRGSNLLRISSLHDHRLFYKTRITVHYTLHNSVIKALCSLFKIYITLTLRQAFLMVFRISRLISKYVRSLYLQPTSAHALGIQCLNLLRFALNKKPVGLYKHRPIGSII